MFFTFTEQHIDSVRKNAGRRAAARAWRKMRAVTRGDRRPGAGTGGLTGRAGSPSIAAMSFAAAIRRSPLPHDAEAGADAAGTLPGQPPEVAEVLRGAGGSSPYLRGLIAQEAEWLEGALAAAPEVVLPGLLADTAALEDAALGPGLRRVKRRLALYAGLADSSARFRPSRPAR